MSYYIMSIDQNTSYVRVVVFDEKLQIKGSSSLEVSQQFPFSGYVEQDSDEIWEKIMLACRNAVLQAGIEMNSILALGIANQRESVIVWDKQTGKPIHRVISWQDKRTSSACESLKENGHEETIRKKTGLMVDPFFSATKIKWILENVPGADQMAKRSELVFGTFDTYLMWRLSDGRIHATDATNASRTMLYNLKTQSWDQELLDLFGIPSDMMPRVMDSSADFGYTNISVFGTSVPICGVAGNQQASMVGLACFEPGSMKTTAQTGIFSLINTGNRVVHSKNRLITTIAYQLNGTPTYAIEGSSFSANTGLNWLRDGLHLITHESALDDMAHRADDHQDIYMVPAFSGLGAPWWDAESRGALYGITHNTTREHIVRAMLEACCFQANDLYQAIQSDIKGKIIQKSAVRVNGTLSTSDWTMQRLSDILDIKIDRSAVLETAALGVAILAALRVGLLDHIEDAETKWVLQKHFTPSMPDMIRKSKYEGWLKAVRRTVS